MESLCNVCASIDLATITDDDREATHGHATFASLQDSASQGCPACQIFVTGLLHKTLEVDPDWPEDSAIQEHLACDSLPYPRLKLWAPRNVNSNARLSDRLIISSTASGPVELALLSTKDGHEFVVRRRTQSDVDFGLARRWINDCLTQHKSCNSLHSAKATQRLAHRLNRTFSSPQATAGLVIQKKTLPTRVIDIGNEMVPPRLIETRGKTGIYCCLSHCWGKEKPTMTTRDNYQDHLKQMPWSTLTQTIRDALVATRQLGYQYIWIDSLCIIQHDADDWVREGSQMQNIFENCVVALAAAAASNGQNGFLSQRPPATSAECTLSDGIVLALPSRKLDMKDEVIPFPQGTAPDSTPRPRLFTRARVMQERLLPPRVLYFGVHETYYECRTCSKREPYWIDVDLPAENIGGIRNANMISPNHDGKEVDYLETWLDFVTEYSSLSLTNWTDRLPAISGLARKFATVIKKEYIAGLWDMDLLHQLCWRHMRVIDDITSGFDSHTYVAPSWSWASSSERVSFAAGRRNEAMATINSCESIAATEDPFGQVKLGSLILTGKVREFVLARRAGKTLEYIVCQSREEMTEGVGVCLFDRPRPPLEDSIGAPVECVVLSREKPRRDTSVLRHIGLVLEPVSGRPSRYRRIGLFMQSLLENDFGRVWDGVEEQRITII